MKSKLLLITALVTSFWFMTSSKTHAEGDKNRYAENNPNINQLTERSQTVSATPAASNAPSYQHQYRYQEVQNPNANQQQTQTQNQGQESEEKGNGNRNDIAGKHAYRLQFRFENYFNRLSTIANKIQQVINQYAKEGKNVSAAQSKLNQATEQLNQAKTQADNSVAAFNAIDPNMYQYQRNLALGASKIANEARSAYQHSLSLMIEAVKLVRQEK